MKNMNKCCLGAILLLIAALVGCGGGGSSGNGSPVAQSFTSFYDVEPDETYEMDGITMEFGPEHYDDEMDSTVRFTLDSEGNVTDVRIDGSSSVSFPDQDRELLYSPDLFWDYQTFGVWQTFDEEIGAFSAGAPTSVDAMPSTETATYLGSSLGRYVSPEHPESILTDSLVTIEAYFADHELVFETMLTWDLTNEQPMDHLDLHGELDILEGSNLFHGDVATQSGLEGGAVGQFYGPEYEEVGGTFVTGNDEAGYIGSFGASR